MHGFTFSHALEEILPVTMKRQHKFQKYKNDLCMHLGKQYKKYANIFTHSTNEKKIAFLLELGYARCDKKVNVIFNFFQKVFIYSSCPL